MRPDPLQQLREVHAVQGRDGCWDIDDYMLGLYNGLELALSLMEQRDVHYKKRQAIAEAEKQEPVAWFGFNDRGEIRETLTKSMRLKFPNYPIEDMTPVYTHPQPRREWVGLTDEERDEIYLAVELGACGETLIEAKLKEKNT